jgi:hypothetical protein
VETVEALGPEQNVIELFQVMETEDHVSLVMEHADEQ